MNKHLATALARIVHELCHPKNQSRAAVRPSQAPPTTGVSAGRFASLVIILPSLMLGAAAFCSSTEWAVVEAWVDAEVDSGYQVGNYNSIAVDASGNPHVGYTGGGVKYARRFGGVWTIETVEAGAERSVGSLALDTQGNPHISYDDGTL